MKVKLILNFICFTLLFALHNNIECKNIIENYEPKHWWSGMNYSNILIAAKGENLNKVFIKIDKPGVTFNKLILTNNPNIVFINIDIEANATSGIIPIQIFHGGKLQQTINFWLKPRIINKTGRQSFSSKDVIYQIIVDRFKNGNNSNDTPGIYLEKPNRINPSGIHGGDIEGIMQELNYIKSLGITSIELSPIYESNQITNSYYHNEITNHYQIDKRLGTEKTLKQLFNLCSTNNIKYIQSMVLHQTSKHHWLFGEDLFEDWIYKSVKIDNSTITSLPEADVYACNHDLIYQFYSENPELNLINQKSQIASKYLIQNTIWWIENTMPDAIKIEKSHFNRTDFLAKLFKQLNKEFPDLTIISDITTTENDELAYLSEQYFQKPLGLNYDYPLSFALADAFSEFVQKEKGILNLHRIMGKDFNYNNSQNHVIFIDNYSTSRAYTLADKNINQLKMMFTFIATTRGIPSIYYGSEILLEGNKRRGLGQSRTDFPGGWTEDRIDAFTGKSLNMKQRDYMQFVSELLRWRFNSSIIHNGNTKHFLLNNNLYGMLRYNSEKDVLILYNNSSNIQKVNVLDCSEQLINYTKAIDPIRKSTYSDLKNLLIESKTALILEFE